MKSNSVFNNKRRSGVLLHPASLPGKHIGSFGKHAYEFVRKLASAGINYWQILPLNPTGLENSPYQSWSAFAGNPLLICPEILCHWGLIDKEWLTQLDYDTTERTTIDYELAADITEFALTKAYEGFVELSSMHEEYNVFCRKNKHWLDDFSVFASLRKQFGFAPVQDWEAEVRSKQSEFLEKVVPSLQNDIDFHKFVQFVFYKQWLSLKQFANDLNVFIIGDLPIYVAADSVDVWSNRQLFEVDNALSPYFVAGVPPDYFSETGQLWGNPVYNWEEHIRSGFHWWIQRVGHNLEMYDAIRIDHFRGFSEYWKVKTGSENASNGEWNNAPGMDLFETLLKAFPELPVIAEDLGILSAEAIALRKQFGFPGMKILQFAFTNPSENEFLPHYYKRNCVVYTGTHDNNTLLGWLKEDALPHEKEFALEYLHTDEDHFSEAMFRMAWSCVANTVVVPVQDVLQLDETARFNVPGTIEGNWLWKMSSEHLNEFPVEYVRKLNMLYARGNCNVEDEQAVNC